MPGQPNGRRAYWPELSSTSTASRRDFRRADNNGAESTFAAAKKHTRQARSAATHIRRLLEEAAPVSERDMGSAIDLSMEGNSHQFYSEAGRRLAQTPTQGGLTFSPFNDGRLLVVADKAAQLLKTSHGIFNRYSPRRSSAELINSAAAGRAVPPHF